MACIEGDVALGLMSGTSMDGIDVCAVRITEKEDIEFEVLGFITLPYPDGLKEELLRVCREGKVWEVCQYHSLLGQLFAEAAGTMVEKVGLEMSDVAVIGSHGQTIYHQPNPIPLFGHNVTSTLQIADPSIIAHRCRVRTVGDFRVADMAAGGQGAPLAPYLDTILCRRHLLRSRRTAIFVNIGGISNMSASSPDGLEVVGFDCGPGNVLIDGCMKLLYGQEMDRDGETALGGAVSDRLLDWLMTDEFILRKPPKSTGREHYNQEFIEEIVRRSKAMELLSQSCVATVTAFTAHAIFLNYQQHVCGRLHCWTSNQHSVDVLVSGGGARNKTLMNCLQRMFDQVHVGTTEEIGIPVDAKEALLFALIAYQTVRKRYTNVPTATGAKHGTILGKICHV